MRNITPRSIASLVFLSLTLAYQQNSHASEENHTQQSPCQIRENLLLRDSQSTYSPFHREKVQTAEGFGIYYIHATIQLSSRELADVPHAMEVRYELPPAFTWGNWVSIRRAFTSVLDLTGCEGLVLELKVIDPSSARLRLTLSDLPPPGDSQSHASDEMWWFDFDKRLLTSATDWVTLRVPLESFYLSYGDGTRHNNGQRDFDRISAFELNLISGANLTPSGSILVRSLYAY